MDFILKAIESKIKRFEGKVEAKIYYQVRVEYCFYLLLAYFWNKNFEELGIEDFILQGNITREIQRPSIGSIATIIQRLDLTKEVDKNIPAKAVKPDLSQYAELRNDLIGHGYSFEDDLAAYSDSFDTWYKRLLDLRIPVLSRKTDLIVCQGYDSQTETYTGTIYDADGEIRSNWRCSKEISDFEIGNLYASYEPNIYYRVSPFIHIETDDDGLYVYRNVQQPLLGKLRYNRIDKSDKHFTKCWEEFELSANNGILRRQPNGCIINVFSPNYKRYIEVGSIKEKVYGFLIGKEKGSSVCITLWGHGGNGKTATAQKICEELSLNDKQPFEFIIFLSAKDRELNKYSGKIVSINNENRITNFDELIENLNQLIYSEKSTDPSRIINDNSKVLIIIDDYETFEDVDKTKITNFIKQLNTNYHKIIITTRNSFLKIGDDIPTNELDISNTVKFLIEVLKIEHIYSPMQIMELELQLKDQETREEIFRLTAGKPIDIIRFVNCFVQKGKLNEGFLREMKRINSKSERIEFLYGRNYSQLAGDKLAQDIFVVIGLLTPQESLTSLISHIKVILNKKDDEEGLFNAAIDKLAKLRLIEIDDDGTYKVDSKDILEIMKQEYDKRDHNFRSGTKAIYDRIKADINSDTGKALLTHTKSLRHQSNPETTIQQYREILKQGHDFTYQVKLEALLDLTDFLFNHRGDKEAAVKVFDEYFDRFYEFEVLKRYASYSWTINKEKSIKILEDFNSNYNNKGLSLKKSTRAHLFSLIVMRETLYWNDKYDYDFANRKRISEEFRRIFNSYGHLLVAQLKVLDVSKELTSEQKNDAVLALEGLVDICVRLNNRPFAIQACKYAMSNFPENYSWRFKKRLDKIHGYRGVFRPSRPHNNTERPELIKNVPLNQIEIINLEPKDYGYLGVVLKKYEDSTKYGYIKLNSNDILGRVYFRESSLKGLNFLELKEGDKVSFGFGKITSTKFGAINVSRTAKK